MTVSSATSFQVVDAGERRVVTASPSGRPSRQAPSFHPRRPVSPGRSAAAASCRVVRQEERSPWLIFKVAVVSLLALAGGVVSTTQIAAALAQPDPAASYVAGDPAWAHVTNP